MSGAFLYSPPLVERFSLFHFMSFAGTEVYGDVQESVVLYSLAALSVLGTLYALLSGPVCLESFYILHHLWTGCHCVVLCPWRVPRLIEMSRSQLFCAHWQLSVSGACVLAYARLVILLVLALWVWPLVAGTIIILKMFRVTLYIYGKVCLALGSAPAVVLPAVKYSLSSMLCCKYFNVVV